MSKPDNTSPVTVVHENTEQKVVVKKPNLVRRGVNFVKSHKTGAIAGTALLGLVGVSAWAGRATAPSIDKLPDHPIDDDSLETSEPDTTVA